MLQLENYDEIMASLKAKNKKRNLLLGNGFSISYNKDFFSYESIMDTIINDVDENEKTILSFFENKNIEEIMKELSLCGKIASVIEPLSTLEIKTTAMSDKFKQKLICAVNSTHPENIFAVSEKNIDRCSIFLSDYLPEGQIYTTNYDLLLYWVLMKGFGTCNDGFGRDDNTKLKWGTNLNSQNIFYLHGALHLYERFGDVYKQENDGDTLIKNITTSIERGEYPIFVSSGSSDEKMTMIRHNYYLSNCYDSLSRIDGSLITFGFRFQDCDNHIIKAINKASARAKNNSLLSVYIGVFSESDQSYIESIKNKFCCEVHVFDSKKVKIWSDN